MAQVQVIIEGEEFAIIPGTPLNEILAVHEIAGDAKDPVVLGVINGQWSPLSDSLWGDEHVGLLRLSHPKTHTTSVHTLATVLAIACDELHPDLELLVDFSFGEGMYCTLGDDMTAEGLSAIESRMYEVIAQNREIVPRVFGQRTLVRMLRDSRFTYTKRAAKYVDPGSVSMSQVEDSDLVFQGLQMPSTRHVRAFSLDLESPGFILLPSRRGQPDEVSEAVQRPKLLSALRDWANWADKKGIADIGGVNSWIAQGRGKELVRLCEARHGRRVVETSDQIAALPDDGRLVLIAGPSSSGKTSTAKRLTLQLKVLGLEPFALSLDDYFVDRDATPKDENGRLDYESIDALQFELLNKHLADLLAGRSVRMPSYDFTTGKSGWADGETILPRGAPLIVEGLHALNPQMAANVPRDSILRLYVSALCHSNIDNVTYLPTTMARIIRRIVRDAQYRGYTASETLSRWPQVRAGEDKWIFPHQENADIVFNSGLAYEMCVLKLWAEPHLAEVGPDDPSYGRARTLLKWLRAHLPLDVRLVPPTSLLREFVGGSGFSY